MLTIRVGRQESSVLLGLDLAADYLLVSRLPCSLSIIIKIEFIY